MLQDRWVGALGGLEQQNAWGFGQVVALCLLILPLFAFLEVIYGKSLLIVSSVDEVQMS